MYTDSRIVVVKGRCLACSARIAWRCPSSPRSAGGQPAVGADRASLPASCVLRQDRINPVSSLFAEQALLALLASIYTSQALEDPGDARAPADNWQVLASYIDAHITDPELGAGRGGCAARHHALGAPAVQDALAAIHRLRARAPLAAGSGGAGGSTARSRRNQEIAASCGFLHASHFIRRFHERFGMSPALYRKQAGSGGA